MIRKFTNKCAKMTEPKSSASTASRCRSSQDRRISESAICISRSATQVANTSRVTCRTPGKEAVQPQFCWMIRSRTTTHSQLSRVVAASTSRRWRTNHHSRPLACSPESAPPCRGKSTRTKKASRAFCDLTRVRVYSHAPASSKRAATSERRFNLP